jgi:hypothetical protein
MGQKQPFEPDLPNVRFAPIADIQSVPNDLLHAESQDRRGQAYHPNRTHLAHTFDLQLVKAASGQKNKDLVTFGQAEQRCPDR